MVFHSRPTVLAPVGGLPPDFWKGRFRPTAFTTPSKNPETVSLSDQKLVSRYLGTEGSVDGFSAGTIQL